MNLKLNNNNNQEGVEDQFNIPTEAEAKSNNNAAKATQNQSYVKEQVVPEGRKMFANKKANIALGIVVALIIIVWVGIKIYIASI